MGVQITNLLSGREIKIEELRGRILVVDAFNTIYQFLTTIRSRDGTMLSDSKGNTTSHLIGLFSRSTKLITEGIKLVFVFDGEPPELKKAERARREEAKEEAKVKFEAAKAREDIDDMRKYASRTVRLTGEMIEESKKLLNALGVPWVQAPSEGEAQAAYMVKKGDAYAVISQDADALLFGAEKLIRNLGVRRRKPNSLSYERTNPEIITLEGTLKSLDMNLDELIMAAIMVGTDFNPGGIKGIGPKKAVKLVKEKRAEEILNKESPNWKEILSLFKNIPVTDDYCLIWSRPSPEAVIQLLVEEHDFSKERVEATIEKLMESNKGQKGLREFF